MNKRQAMILRSRQGKKAMLRYYLIKQEELNRKTLLHRLMQLLRKGSV
jgi:hypothetical protein